MTLKQHFENYLYQMTLYPEDIKEIFAAITGQTSLKLSDNVKDYTKMQLCAFTFCLEMAAEAYMKAKNKNHLGLKILDMARNGK